MILEEHWHPTALGSCGLVFSFLGGGFEPMLKSKWTCPALMSEACLEYFFVAASLGQFLGYAWTGDFLLNLRC